MDRNLPTSAIPIAGAAMVDRYAELFGVLLNNMSLRPITITNSGNDYTIDVDPTLDADVINGMSFMVQPNVVNGAGGVRMRVSNLNPFHNVVWSNGLAIGEGDFKPDTIYWLYFVDGEFRVLSAQRAATGGTVDFAKFQEFLLSGTWNKPPDIDPDAWILVEIWGGGGGGGGAVTASGGGGGAYNWRLFRASELPPSVFISIGSGGAIGGEGGLTTFDIYLSAYGGGGGGVSTANGGGGGGITSAGTSTGAGGGPNYAAGLIASVGMSSSGSYDGTGAANYGAGCSGTNSGTTAYGIGGSAIWGGGGGGRGATGSNLPARGGASIYGGAGGGGTNGASQALGGVSMFGGNGGTGNPGDVGGGGGAANRVGGAGRAWVRIIG